MKFTVFMTVKILVGFYAGCTGRVYEVHENWFDSKYATYHLGNVVCKDHFLGNDLWVDQDNLELVK
jgi:hypothetical protein